MKSEINLQTGLEGVRQADPQEKHEKLEDFIARRAELQEKIADLTLGVAEEFSKNPKIHPRRLAKSISRSASEVGIPKTEAVEVQKFGRDLILNNKKIERLRKRFPDERKLATYLLGFEPEGEVEIDHDEFTFYITLLLSRDYKKAVFNDQSGGTTRFSYRDGIDYVMYNVYEYGGKTKKHEQTHVIYGIASRATGDKPHWYPKSWTIDPEELPEHIINMPTDGEKDDFWKRYFWETVLLQDRRIADEFFSFLRDGSSPKEISQILLAEGGDYDYNGFVFNNILEIIKSDVSANDFDLASKVANDFRTKYYPEFINGLAESVQRLIDIGFSGDKIVALLFRVHITRWGREIDRIVKAKNQSEESAG